MGPRYSLCDLPCCACGMFFATEKEPNIIEETFHNERYGLLTLLLQSTTEIVEHNRCNDHRGKQKKYCKHGCGEPE